MNYEWVAFILLFPVSAILGCISAKLMTHNKRKTTKNPMKIKIKLSSNQESKIVAKSLQQAYDLNYGMDSGINKGDIQELQEALRIVFHYYTGKTLK